MILETELWSQELSDGEAAAVVGGGAEAVGVTASVTISVEIDPDPAGLGPTRIPASPVPPAYEPKPTIIVNLSIQG